MGGVHSENFPEIVPPGSVPNNISHFDPTPDRFDTLVASKFVDGTTKDPLVINNRRQNSDLIVFASDRGNATIRSMTDPNVFQSTCLRMFQRMIEIVPNSVMLTDVIQPYEVKPYDVQLTLLDGGTSLRFTGDIRVRTTERPSGSIIAVQL